MGGATWDGFEWRDRLSRGPGRAGVLGVVQLAQPQGWLVETFVEYGVDEGWVLGSGDVGV